MIERPPQLTDKDIAKAYIDLSKKRDDELTSLIEKINERYEYWSDVKYEKTPPSLSNTDLWKYVKTSRLRNYSLIWPKYGIFLSVTNHMQRLCHEFDMNFGGSWGSHSMIPTENKDTYLINSLMEEAISSSQMEGAFTTRKIAKEMLRKNIAPKDKSQQMIFNNYQTIQFIVNNKQKPLTKELLLTIHRLMTENTLENPADVGRFRQNDEVVVENGITHEIVHTPPSYQEIPTFINELCSFFNDEQPSIFIHPIIRGIVVHFMIAYMHPFVDGNGRTARALFYWYMLKNGYWLTEYLSISKIIAKSKKAYENSYLYVEADDNDLGYFITYNLRVLNLAFRDLQDYIKKKQAIKEQNKQFLHLGNINERQADIIRVYYDNPKEVLTIKDIQVKFGITPTTAKSDITGLINLGLLSEISFNKVKKGYIKNSRFDDIIANIL